MAVSKIAVGTHTIWFGLTNDQKPMGAMRRAVFFEIDGLYRRWSWNGNGWSLSYSSAQCGDASLGVGGAVTITANLLSTSHVFAQLIDLGNEPTQNFAGLVVTTRTVGNPGSFTVVAVNHSNNIITTARCSFSWAVLDGVI